MASFPIESRMFKKERRVNTLIRRLVTRHANQHFEEHEIRVEVAI